MKRFLAWLDRATDRLFEFGAYLVAVFSFLNSLFPEVVGEPGPGIQWGVIAVAFYLLAAKMGERRRARAAQRIADDDFDRRLGRMRLGRDRMDRG